MAQRTLRARATKNERKKQDSFEGLSEEEDESMTDFSVSEDEWKPNDKNEKTEESTEDDISEDEEASLASGSDEGDDSIAVTPNSKWAKSQNRPGGGGGGGKRPAYISPKTREMLYQKYSKKKPDTNSSLADILKASEFKKKKELKKKPVEAYDSDSSGDDYLVDPNKLDLNSDFFKISTPKPGGIVQKTMQFDCNAGMNLSDSSDDDEGTENVGPKISALPLKTDKKNLINTLNEQSIAKCFNLKKLEDYSRQIEVAKEQMKNYKSSENAEKLDVTNLLALGEGESFEQEQHTDTVQKPSKNRRKVFSDSETEWEEVAANESKVTPNEVEILVAGQEKRKRNIDWEIEMYIKRQINRVKRENQLNLHKAHILTTIALGNHINETLNKSKHLGMALSLMQDQACYPKNVEKVDVKFYEKFIKWFKSNIKLKSKDNYCKKAFSSLDFSLALQIFTKAADCKRDFVLLFVIFLRALGIDARFVISANLPPKRPHLNDLVPMSERKGHTKSAKLEEEVKKEIEAYYKGIEEEKGSKSKSENKKVSPVKIEENKAKSSELVAERSEIADKSSEIDEKPVEMTENSTKTKLSPKVVKSKKGSKKSSDVEAGQSEAVMEKSSMLMSKVTTKKGSTRNNLEVPIETEDDVEKTTRKSPRSRKATPKMIEMSNGKKKGNNSKNEPKEPEISESEAANVVKRPTRSKRKNEADTVSPNENKKAKISETSIDSKTDKRSTRRALASMNIPQLDGLNDDPRPKKMTRRQEQMLKKQNNFESPKQQTTSKPASPRTPFTPKQNANKNKGKGVAVNKIMLEKSDKISKSIVKSKTVPEDDIDSDLETPSNSIEPKTNSQKSKTFKNKPKDIPKSKAITEKTKAKDKIKEKKKEKEAEEESSASEYEEEKSESDYEVPKKRKKSTEASKKSGKVPNKTKTSKNSFKEQKGFDYWVEVYDAAKENWLAVDIFSGKINAVDIVARAASHPLCYVFAWNKNNKIKDVSPRYCPNWNTVKRKHRVECEWLAETLEPFKAEKSEKDSNEDKELDKLGSEHPMPTTITEFKNHPLYALPRHFLKFEALYPPDAPSLGFLRGEPIYARECVHTLMTREKWYKEGMVVRPKEEPYRVLKHMKWDRATNKFLKDQPLDVFGKWQTDPYDPPTAENGIVPRNEYGNVELFQPSMLPKKTVHLQLPGLNRVCKRLNIDCASAIIGFESHKMRSHPIYDGFVVCEEFADLLVEEWYKEQEEEERKENEKREKRIYDNWKKLIKGLLIRKKLQNKYNFDNLG